MWNIMKIRVLEAGDDSVKEKKSFFFLLFSLKRKRMILENQIKNRFIHTENDKCKKGQWV